MKRALSVLLLAFSIPVSAYEQDKDLSGAFYTNTAFGLCQVTGRHLTSLASQAASEALPRKTVMERLAAPSGRIVVTL